MYARTSFLYRRVCGEASDGVSHVARIGEQVEGEVAVEGCRRLLYYFVSEEVRGQFLDLTVVSAKNFLLEDLGVRAGEMFGTLEGHSQSAHVELPTVFLFLPTAGGDFPEVIIEKIAQPVVEQSFTGPFEEGRAWGSQGLAVFVVVLGIKTGGPFVGFEEADDAAVAAGGDKRDEFGGGEDVLFLNLQRFLVYVIVHTVAMLTTAEVS